MSAIAKHDKGRATMHWSKRRGGQGARAARRGWSPGLGGHRSCAGALNSWFPRIHVESGVLDDYFSLVVMPLWPRERELCQGYQERASDMCSKLCSCRQQKHYFPMRPIPSAAEHRTQHARYNFRARWWTRRAWHYVKVYRVKQYAKSERW